MNREQPLAEFIDALHVAATADTAGMGAEDKRTAAVDRIFAALSTLGVPTPVKAVHLDACKHIGPALATARPGPAPTARLADALGPLVPSLHWYLRPRQDGEDPRFRDGHANAHIVGPSGLEHRDDVLVGVSVVGPGVTYPDHSHPPEEIYVVMSEGEWFNEDDGWYTPGVGSVVHHRADVVHAMRAGNEPLLAIWCLRRP